MKKITFTCVFALFFMVYKQAQVFPLMEVYGASEMDRSSAVTIDKEGFIYLTGSFNSTALNFGTLTVSNSSSAGGYYDVFIAKLAPDLSPLWAVSSSGATTDIYSNDIVVDDNYVYIIGSYENGSLAFGSASPITNSGGSDFFISCFCRLDGSHQWTISDDGTSGTGDLNEFGEGLAISDDGLLFFIGSTNSDELEIDGTSLINVYPGSSTYEIFAGIIDVTTSAPSLSLLVKPDGYFGDAFGKDISIDDSSNFYITGYFYCDSLDFDTEKLYITNAYALSSDIFLAKYDVTGSCKWAHNPGGDLEDFALAVEVYERDVFITGGFKSDDLLFNDDIGLELHNPQNLHTDYFLAKYDAITGEAIWAVTADANIDPFYNFDEYGYDLSVDNHGNVYVTGWYNSYVINYGTGTDDLINTTNNDYSEPIIAKYSNEGIIQWIESGHGVYNNRGMGVAVAPEDGCCVITGWYESDPFDFETYTWNLENPVEISDFYVAYVCGYSCNPSCDDWMEILHTGLANIGEEDPYWQIIAAPAASGISTPQPATACIWNTSAWSYGFPLSGTNWISVDSMPGADIGVYTFERTFYGSVNCPTPVLNICIMADDTVEVFLNGVSIGSGGSLDTPIFISHSNASTFDFGLNTLTVDVHNTIPYMMAFNMKAYFCCNDTTTHIIDKKIDNEFNITLYPNPTTNIVNIEATKNMKEIEVINHIGQVLKTFSINAYKTQLALANLSPGFYYINIKSEKGDVVSKRIILLR